jgi:hypothetical protein
VENLDIYIHSLVVSDGVRTRVLSADRCDEFIDTTIVVKAINDELPGIDYGMFTLSLKLELEPYPHETKYPRYILRSIEILRVHEPNRHRFCMFCRQADDPRVEYKAFRVDVLDRGYPRSADSERRRRENYKVYLGVKEESDEEAEQKEAAWAASWAADEAKASIGSWDKVVIPVRNKTNGKP